MPGAASPAPFDMPPAWSNGPLVVYHGTLATHALSIKTLGVNPLKGRVGTDFGPGFDTTTVERQAKSWAWLTAAATTVGGPVAAGAVVRLELDRDALARLDSIEFIRGDYDAEDFWSLVFHCRGGALGHARPPAAPYYDVVYGPVASFWMQRNAMNGADQISFHSNACTPVLAVKGVDPI